jgi:hypothetical protein
VSRPEQRYELVKLPLITRRGAGHDDVLNLGNITNDFNVLERRENPQSAV